MARIYYGLAGEGRGHATRACTLVDALRGEHEIVLFAPGHAHRLLAPRYAGSDVRVVEIEGPTFGYDDRGRVDKLRTTLGALRYVRRLSALVGGVEQHMRRARPDLCITDFDPLVPRAAERLGIPYLSVDHQHFLAVNRLDGLPRRLRAWAWFMGRIVRLYYRRQVRAVVSSFYFPPIRPAWRDRAVQTGVLLRPELRAARPEHGDHVCVYLRRFAPPNVLESLRSLDRPVHVYGVGAGPPDRNLTFREVDALRFAEDLATATALVSTAGNQLLGEALWLGKPCFVFPEPGNQEQEINAHYLGASGAGDWRRLRDVTPPALRAFVDAVETFRARIDRSRLDGNAATLDTVREVLRSGAAPPDVTAAATRELAG